VSDVSPNYGDQGKWDCLLEYGSGAGGIKVGPLSAPDLASATGPGRGHTTRARRSFVYPDTYDTGGAPSYWVDVEVTPGAAAPAC
jgi:hypothetical protein